MIGWLLLAVSAVAVVRTAGFVELVTGMAMLGVVLTPFAGRWDLFLFSLLLFIACLVRMSLEGTRA